MIRLVSVNIERSKHLDLVLPFLAAQEPDVVCFQELVEKDVPRFLKTIGGEMLYAPELNHPHENDTTPAVVGTALWSRLPISGQRIEYYVGEAASSEAIAREEVRTTPARSALVSFDVHDAAETFRIATTHLTWTPKGLPTDEQRRNLEALLRALLPLGDLVLTGDFNAPRGGEVWGKLAERYRDNIPARYLWSLDTALHRAGGGQLQENARSAGLPGFVVDGLFTTPRYEARGAELIPGVSDHMAAVADIAVA